jgi:hypothetical protein
MKLNSFQRKRLRLAIQYRGRTVPLGIVLLSAWKFYAVLLLATGGGAAWLLSIGDDITAGAFIGFLVAVVWRDFIYARVSARFKPVSDAVTDWEKVNELLGDQADT